MSEKQRFLGIKKFRVRMELTQRQLAKMLGCKSPAVYHHWETGKNDPSFIVVQKLLEMGATVEELFGVDYSPSAKSQENDKIKELESRIESLEAKNQFREPATVARTG